MPRNRLAAPFVAASGHGACDFAARFCRNSCPEGCAHQAGGRTPTRVEG